MSTAVAITSLNEAIQNKLENGLFHVIFYGDEQCGKSSVFRRFLNEHFCESITATGPKDIISRQKIVTINNENTNFKFWYLHIKY